MAKPVYVLGTAVSHDGSTCLLKDGRITVAIEKERISRIKHDGGNDTDAIQYCLDAEGLAFEDLALVVQNDNFGMFEAGSDWYQGPRLTSPEVPVVSISHHLAHAYSAVGLSPFEEAAVLVVDGCGNCFADCIDREGAQIPQTPPDEFAELYFEKDSYYAQEGGALRAVYKDFSPLETKRYTLHPNTTRHSIGGAYLGVSTYVFRGVEDPGKLMGLAPYGKPKVHDFEIFDLREGRVFLRYDWMRRFDKPARTPEDLRDNFQHYADLAFHTQRELERALLYLIEHRHKLHPSRNLAFAGGVALNAVANAVLLERGPFENLFPVPAAADNGLAVGCAYYGWLHHLKGGKKKHSGSMYLGRCYRADQVQEAIDEAGAAVRAQRPRALTREVAEHLAQGKVIGWFQGGAEFGPRALGHRSLLADPRRADMRDFINREIKFREDFRPFAPSVLREAAGTYFELEHESPYMILVAPTREAWREKIPAVVHEDGSARVQTVTAQSEPRYAQLLSDFGALTGVPILLNTSLNRRGQPIVERPAQALDLLLETAMDALVLEDLLIWKTGDAQEEDQTTDHWAALAARLERAVALEGAPSLTVQVEVEQRQRRWLRLEQGRWTMTDAWKENPMTTLRLWQPQLLRLISRPDLALDLIRSGELEIIGADEGADLLLRSLRANEDSDSA